MACSSRIGSAPAHARSSEMNTSIAYFGDPGRADCGSPWNPSPAQATAIGSSSVFLWAVWPSLAVLAAPTPTFQTLAIGMAVGFLCLATIRLLRGERIRDMRPRSRSLLVAGVIGIFGTNAFNFIAITRISPAQASLIAYSWPMMAILLAGAFGLRRLGLRHAVAVALGFLGAACVIDPFGNLTFDAIGIGFAFLAGLSWAGYTTYRLVDDRSPSDAVGIYSLIAATFCLVVHLLFETTHAMEPVQLAAVLGLGLAPMGLANAVWDFGVARGDARTLAILAYGTPLVAAMLLVLFGLSSVTPLLIVGALLIVSGAAIGTWPGRRPSS